MSNRTPATRLNIFRSTAMQWNWVSRGLMLKLVAVGLSSLVLLIISALAMANPQALVTSSVGYTLGAGVFMALTFEVNTHTGLGSLT